MLVIQMLLNVSGVIGIFPLSGKPVPFVSYGGSSVMSSLMLAGLVVSVALHTTQGDPEPSSRRASLRLAPDDADTTLEGSTAGRATPRSARLAGTRFAARTPKQIEATERHEDTYANGESSRSKLRLLEGGSKRTQRRSAVDERGRGRIDLGPSGADRLRGRRTTKR